MTTQGFRELVLTFPGVEENPHFDRAAFKVINKRIFTTLHEKSGTANLKLSLKDQQSFISYNKDLIYAVPNKWGEKGWTTIEIGNVPEELVLGAVEAAYNNVLNPK